MSALKTCVTVFLGTIEARILKRGIHIDNELMYHVIESQAHCLYFSLYLSIFLPFHNKVVSQFPGSVHMAYICGIFPNFDPFVIEP